MLDDADDFFSFGSAGGPTAHGHVQPANLMLSGRQIRLLQVDIASSRDTLQVGFDRPPGDVNLGTYSDDLRRLQVSKTILLRNART